MVVVCDRLLGHLDAARLAVDEARVDLLARLLDGLEHGFVVEAWLGYDEGFLLLEGDFVALDACFVARLLAHLICLSIYLFVYLFVCVHIGVNDLLARHNHRTKKGENEPWFRRRTPLRHRKRDKWENKLTL